MKRALLTAVAALVAMYALAVTWRQNERAAGLDFYIYFVAAQLAGRADVQDIYAPEVQGRIGEEYYERAQRSGSELRKYDAQRRRRLDNVSSPFLYATMRWVSRDYERALRQYHALVMFAFVAGFILMARLVRLSWVSTLFLLAGVLLYYRGFEADLRVGNVNSLQLLAIGVVVWLDCGNASGRLRPSQVNAVAVAQGALLGMLICFKPNVMFVPLLLLFARAASRTWKRLSLEMTGLAVGASVAFVVAATSFRSLNVWRQWITAANQFWHRLPTRAERNVTPALALFHEQGQWISYAIAAALTAIACAAIRRGGKRIDELLVVGVALLIYLMSATVVWLHYMVLVVPVALALMRWRITAVVALLALATIAEEPFEMLAGNAAAPVESMLITPALVVLFVCATWKLSHPDPPTC